MITKINNKYYCLEHFNHPGGEQALSTCFYRDGTTLFETHHPFVNKTTLNNILSEYEVKPCSLNIETDNTFHFNSEFANELKINVFNYIPIKI